MTTRGRDSKPPKMNETELEELRAQLAIKEAELLDQAKKLSAQKEKIVRDKEAHERDLKKIEQNLSAREAELNKKLNTLLENEPENERTNIHIGPDVDRTHGENASMGPSPFLASNARAFDMHTPGPYHSQDLDPNGPRVSFREALETIPVFDGRNLPLSQFTRACRRVKEIFPPSVERNLTRLLLTKLRGRAVYAVEDETCETVNQLIDLLNEAFGSFKTLDQYRGELSTAFLHPHEHILDYISRTKDLRTAIMDATRREHGILQEQTIKEIDALTARSFCNGLPLSFRLQLTPNLYSNPFSAFSYAKSLAKRQELDNERFSTPNRSERHTYNAARPLAHSTPMRLTYERPAPPRRTDNATPRTHETTYDRVRSEPPRTRDDKKICRYCKNVGHEIEECRKRAYNNARKSPGNDASPSGLKGATRTDPPSKAHPIRVITTEDEPSTSRC